MVSRVIPVDPFDLVIFGATGDLARRKILPGLYRRFHAGQMPEGARVIGAARTDQDNDAWRAQIREAILENVSARLCEPDRIDEFLGRLSYFPIDATGEGGWKALAGEMRDGVVQAFYFSVAPGLFGELAERLREHGIARDGARVVVEKPFGRDLDSARALNATLDAHFDEHQIYRIDHYLGKETVQNLMAVRFANVLFEPLWNAQFIDHVQITVAESVGVGGRGSYYDKSGAMRDMVQNHLMQLLCLTAMEPPAHFNPDAVRDEKLKVIRALDPVEPSQIVRGQYKAGEHPSYREDAENPDSRTESFIALRAHVANWRWNGTPFYLRTGKRMKARMSEMRMTIKEPGPGGMRLMEVPLDMTFAEALGEEAEVPDAYERLIMDVIRGNQTLFMRGDEVEAAWAWTDPIIAGWTSREDVPLPYDAGSAGPEDALMLLHKDGRRWREITA